MHVDTIVNYFYCYLSHRIIDSFFSADSKITKDIINVLKSLKQSNNFLAGSPEDVLAPNLLATAIPLSQIISNPT